jgi:hypothetical protein
MGLLDNAKNTSLLGLRGAGQISPAMLSQYGERAIKKFYLDSGILRIATYIDEVEGQKSYSIEAPEIDSIANASRIISLGITSFEDNDSPSESTLQYVSPVLASHYSVKPWVSSGSLTWKLELGWEPGQSREMALQLVQAYSATIDDHIPGFVETEATEAITALIRHYLLSETGRPWTEPQLAMAEFGKYMLEMGKCRISAEKGYTQADITAKPVMPFVI